MDDAFRTVWLRRTIAAALLAGMFLSSKLWLTTRSYPFVPIFNFLSPIPPPFDAVLYGAALFLLLLILLLRSPWYPTAFFLILIGFFALFDQTRWQPWVYMYTFMLAAFVVARSHPGRILSVCRLIVAATYFWSGVQKLNVHFIEKGFPWLLEPFSRSILPTLSSESLFSLAVLIAMIECAIGIGLFLRQTRTTAILLVFFLHFFIFLSIGPWGHNWNHIVWPWNIAMILFVFLLFWDTDGVSLRDLFPRRSRGAYHAAVFVLFACLPLLSSFGLWDAYLSAALYTNNATIGSLVVSNAVKEKLPPDAQQWFSGNRVYLQEWSMGELRVMPYPEERVHRGILQALCAYAQQPTDVKLTVRRRLLWVPNEPGVMQYDCASVF